ncbi:MAG: metallophosphoesterase family protein [Thermodesulfovibrionales bacterium]|nr:metallophosphoesterase family protein [Thermodesulfovibrionales bacterium]
MRYAVISDVHANIEALEAALRDIRKQAPEAEILFLGDAVGYGPEPNECVSLLRDTCRILIAGNHDWGVLGLTNIEYFNEYARAAIHWTKDAMLYENMETLRAFPLTKSLDNILLVHSTPIRPSEWNYLLTMHDAEANFGHFREGICFVGHSHRPFILERLASGEMRLLGDRAKISKGRRYIINAGSVGQPRDGDPRACYAIIKDGRIELMRVGYDIEKTQGKMRKAGLPVFLIERLSEGR